MVEFNADKIIFIIVSRKRFKSNLEIQAHFSPVSADISVGVFA